MITANVLHRVFKVRCNGHLGTAFTIERDAREYLITARHSAEYLVHGAPFEILSFGQWKPFNYKLVGDSIPPIDISVLALDKLLTPPGLPITATNQQMYYGQDVFFLGFPYDFLGNIVLGNGGFHLPFARKAIISNLDGDRIFLDGHNVKGFSGGPVVFKNIETNQFQIAGVIAAFKHVSMAVYDNEGNKVPFQYLYNTGLVEAWEIKCALELIAQNPIGQPIESAIS